MCKVHKMHIRGTFLVQNERYDAITDEDSDLEDTGDLDRLSWWILNAVSQNSGFTTVIWSDYSEKRIYVARFFAILGSFCVHFAYLRTFSSGDPIYSLPKFSLPRIFAVYIFAVKLFTWTIHIRHSVLYLRKYTSYFGKFAAEMPQNEAFIITAIPQNFIS